MERGDRDKWTDLGNFVVGVVGLLLTIYFHYHPPLVSASKMGNNINWWPMLTEWAPPSLLCSAILTGAWLHWKAARLSVANHGSSTALPRAHIDESDVKQWSVVGPSLIDVIPECSDAQDKWIYKTKVRLIFRNNSEKTIEVSAPNWIADANEVPCQEQVEATLQVEGPKGFEQDDWQGPEVRTIHVRPGRVFRLWVGLSLDVSRNPQDRSNELRRRAITKELGTLGLIVDGKKWSIRL